MPSARLQRLLAKVGLPMIALLAAAGLSTAVAATYLTFTGDSSVGSFSPDGVPVEMPDSTTTSTSTTLVVETTTTTIAAPAGTPTTEARARTTTTARPTTRATSEPARATTTTECSNSGKGNCRSRGGKPDDD